MEQASHPVLQIGDFRVEPSLNRVTQNGKTVRIAPKAMQVLMRLAERPGEAVSRDDLLDTVWSDAAVNEEVLTRTIADLRKAFQDSPRQPRIIETIPKSGYSLVAPVAFGGGRPSGLESHAQEPQAKRASSPMRLPILVGGFALIALSLVGYALYDRYASWLGDPPVLLLETRPLTSSPDAEIFAEISPDGKQVAYVQRSGPQGSWDIYIQIIGSSSSLQLTRHPAQETSPAWSPDGTRIAFARYHDQQCSIFSVDALGGDERKLGSCGRNSNPDVAYLARWSLRPGRSATEARRHRVSFCSCPGLCASVPLWRSPKVSGKVNHAK